MNVKQHLVLIRDLHDLYKTRPLQSYQNVSYANWYTIDPQHYWFTRFIAYWLKEQRISLRFYSEFGPRKTVQEKFQGIKVFYTGENVAPIVRHERLHYREEKVAGWSSRMKTYRDFCSDSVDLCMGFDQTGADNYMRFPFWILRFLSPEFGPEEIETRLEEINHMPVNLNRNGCCLIASHDFLGSRTDISDTLLHTGALDYIEFAGKYRHNTERLQQEFQNDKAAYLAQFRFNICPENMDAPFYVTEKIFDAFAGGAIPIYGGALGNPEPEIILPDSYIHWDFEGDNSEAVREVRRLREEDAYYQEFMKQPRFRKGAGEYIFETYYRPLREKLAGLIQEQNVKL
ncbi:MAG: glycosyltransferase family 10 [Lachnospiraceae bacterium]|jgi:hypothetical protein|nr:glycosyltransferase family 10 [Lachnospiraceae bacterium]